MKCNIRSEGQKQSGTTHNLQLGVNITCEVAWRWSFLCHLSLLKSENTTWFSFYHVFYNPKLNHFNTTMDHIWPHTSVTDVLVDGGRCVCGVSAAAVFFKHVTVSFYILYILIYIQYIYSVYIYIHTIYVYRTNITKVSVNVPCSARVCKFLIGCSGGEYSLENRFLRSSCLCNIQDRERMVKSP